MCRGGARIAAISASFSAETTSGHTCPSPHPQALPPIGSLAYRWGQRLVGPKFYLGGRTHLAGSGSSWTCSPEETARFQHKSRQHRGGSRRVEILCTVRGIMGKKKQSKTRQKKQTKKPTSRTFLTGSSPKCSTVPLPPTGNNLVDLLGTLVSQGDRDQITIK